MVHSFTLGGTDMSSYGLTVITPSTYPLYPDARMDVDQYGGADGAALSTAYRKPLYLHLECVVKGKDNTTLRSYMDSIKSVLDIENGEQLLILDDEDRAWYAKLHNPIQPQVRRGHYVIQLAFIIPSGYAVEKTETTGTQQTIDADPKTLYVPAAAGSTVGGTADCPPTITLINTDATTLSDITITNETTSQEMNWTGALVQNAQLKITSETGAVERSTDGGTTWSEVGSSLRGGDPFIELAGGSRNEFTIEGFVGGTFDITYRGRYL